MKQKEIMRVRWRRERISYSNELVCFTSLHVRRRIVRRRTWRFRRPAAQLCRQPGV